MSTDDKKELLDKSCNEDSDNKELSLTSILTEK